MLPGHYYPKLKKILSFFGNYGNAWWNKKKNLKLLMDLLFLLLTVLFLHLEKATYNDRIFTTNAAGFPGWKRIPVGKRW